VKVPLSWIRDFVDVSGSPEEIGARMSLRGLALEGIERTEAGDAVLDFDVTANRPDCLSIIGIAREIATAYSLPLKKAALPSGHSKAFGFGFFNEFDELRSAGPSVVTEAISVSILDTDLCPRYVAAVADVTVEPSPDWMQSRLLACGIRPISNIVDITNYVLLELGYPMHAFDLTRLAGPAIVVRRAKPDEKLRTLDGKDRTLDADMLVIADAERAQAIGGVMGGAGSEVTEQTRQVVFEAAWFKPQSVRATSKRLGLRTEASYRFERGADLTGTVEALCRALSLLAATGAGRVKGPILDCHPLPHVERALSFDAALIQRVLGMNVPDDDTERILNSLGFEVKTLGGWQASAPDGSMSVGHAGHGWQVTVPGWRVDVHRPVDIIEEVGRHYGFEHLPTTFPAVEKPPPPSDSRIARDARVRGALLGMGLSEAITFAFIETAAATAFLGGHAPVILANPLSEKFTTLRPSLLPGLIDAVSHNRRHGRRDVRLFEIGTRFSRRGETRAAAAAWTGAATPEHWSGGRRDVDFFDVKGVAAQLCELMHATAQFAPTTAAYLVDGRAAELYVNGESIGVLGQLDSTVARQRDLPEGDSTYVLEIDLDALTAQEPADVRLTRPLPRHPSVLRDVSILVDDTLSAETVRGTIRSADLHRGAGEVAAGVRQGDGGAITLVEIREFDRYQGEGIPDGKVSLSLRLTFQAADRTLTDSEVHVAMEGIIAMLTTQLGAIQR